MTIDIRIATAAAFGGESCRALLESLNAGGSPVVGLATGNTPVALYEALATEARAGRVRLADSRPFAIDEFGGAREHACSNRVFFRRYWDVIPGAPPVEQFDPEAPSAEDEVERFRLALAAAGGLDVVLLGIGRNGHLAFNEPGIRADASAHVPRLTEATRVSARACWGEGAPAWGMTLGLGEILNARRALLIANGAAKAAVVARALQGEVSVACPASFLQRHPACTVVLDRAAASRLR